MSKPVIKAKFVLGADGRPQFVKGGGLKHFKIKLFVEDAPEAAFAATYRLHPTYIDPIREVRHGPRFEEEITSYGDYDLKVQLRAKGGGDVLVAPLSGALKSEYGPNPDDAITEAIRAIETDQED